MSLYFRHPGQTVWPNAHTGCPSSCQEIRAVCSSDAARWRRGRKKGSSAQGRMAAPLPGDPRPGKVSKVLSVGVSLASVCSSHGVRARSSTNGFQPYTKLSGIVLLPTVDAANERSISLDDPLNYNLRFGEMSSTRQKNQPIFENSLEYPNCRRCTIANPHKTQVWSEPTPFIPRHSRASTRRRGYAAKSCPL